MDNITIYTTFFPQNKYASWYINIIHNRLMNPILENGEFHHIIPNCFYNIDNFNLPHTKTDNDYNHKVKLSYREHFICHFLLWKMFPYKSIQRQKLAYAFSMMRCNSGNRHTSHSYKYAKKALIEASSMRTGNNNSMYGKKHSYETKQLIRERKLGKPLSQSHRDNISKSCAGRAFTQAHRDNLSNSHKDKQFSKSHRDNISKSRSSTLYVSNDTLRITKYINKTELDTYIANGWYSGKVYDSNGNIKYASSYNAHNHIPSNYNKPKVISIDGIIYKSFNEAIRKSPYSRRHIHKCLNDDNVTNFFYII